MSATLSLATVRGRWRVLPILDVVLGLGLLAYGVAFTARDALVQHPWMELAAAVMAGSVLLRTRAPLAMAVVAAIGTWAYALQPNASSPLWMFLTILVVCFSVGAHLEGRRRWLALGILLCAAYAIQLASVDRNDASDNTFSEIWLSPLVIIGGPALAGELLQRSRRQTAELERLTTELAGERERHAAAAAVAERNRIARELHDVISHAVSVMVVQAGAAEGMLDAGSPARARVRAVRETGREAMAELRRQLGLLRGGPESTSSPLPGLAEIPDLVETAGAELVTAGLEGADVAPGLGLTAYRVVQEALTNARRHAPGARVEVGVRFEGDVLVIAVDDHGSGVSPERGAGQGLAGMRERVEMYGGRLEAGPDERGRGWRVLARLPLDENGAPR